MARSVNVKGFEEYKKSVEQLARENSKLFVYFTGEKDEKGASWCPDCNQAEPFVQEALDKFTDIDSLFLTVDVGNREFWKDMNNPFREDSDIKLMVIPTLLRWNGVARLEDDQCKKIDLLEMLFREDE